MKVAVLINGGHLRALAKDARRHYDPDLIEKAAHACVEADEVLLRVLYYDCAPWVAPELLWHSDFKRRVAWPA